MVTRPIKLTLRRVADVKPSTSSGGVFDRRLSFSRCGLGYRQHRTLPNLFMLPPSECAFSAALTTGFSPTGER
jgi:hypothetical protein